MIELNPPRRAKCTAAHAPVNTPAPVANPLQKDRWLMCSPHYRLYRRCLLAVLELLSHSQVALNTQSNFHPDNSILKRAGQQKSGG
jgi:hypothetical protein